MTDSKIVAGAGGTTFAGPDAVALFQAAALKTGIRLLSKGICPRRGWTMTKALRSATVYTGQTYRRTEHERACCDLKVWIETMRSALPVEHGS